MFNKSGYDYDNIDIEVVIMIGEAIKKENSEKIQNIFSGYIGKFMCATYRS